MKRVYVASTYMTMTKEIAVYLQKAQPMPSDQTVPDLKIEVTDLVNTEGMNLDEMREFYAGQARGLIEAMFKSLPGGLIDAILVEMMRRKVSVFAVAYEMEKGQI